MKIGALSKATNISVDTIRYYEQRKLIPLPQRTASGYRCYSKADATRLQFIVQAKELGFTLEEIRLLLNLRGDGDACIEVRSFARAKADDIEKRIEKLSRIRETLLSLANQCEKTSANDPCPILKSLEKTR